MEINTSQDWWNAVNAHWPKLRDILYRFLPMNGFETKDGLILTYPLGKYVEELKEKRDTKLEGYFQSAWAAAPDKDWIREIPGWFLLCDLCSENYVLFEENL